MEPLAKIENYLCPQLDYIKKDWDSPIVQQFIDRYNNGHVRHKDKLDIYLNDQPIQTVLMVYQLDTEKFWYFLLFAADYAEGLGSFFSSNPTPIEQLESVFSLIEANLQPHVIPQGGYVFKNDPNMELTLTVKKPGMKQNKAVHITTPNALALLADIYRKADKSNPLFNMSIGGSFEGQHPIVAQRLALFYSIMKAFLKPIEAQKGVVDRDTSIDKGYLISQLAYVMELTPPEDTRFIDPLRPRYLHDYVKAYLGDSIMGLNEHYNYDYYFTADD